MTSQQVRDSVKALFQPPLPVSIGGIAERLGATVAQVRYVLLTRRIDPVGSAGHANLYDEAAVQKVREALAEIAARRGE